MPCRQRLHCPQPAWISTVTRWPIRYSSTPGPSATTRAHIFVAGREVLVERQATLDQRRRAVVDDFQVGGTDRDRIDTQEDFSPLGRWDRLLCKLEFAWVTEDPGLHRWRDRELWI